MDTKRVGVEHVKSEHMRRKLGQEAVKDDLLIPSPQQLGSESS